MKTVTVYYPVERVTDKAVSLRTDFGIVWLPKSQVECYKRNTRGSIEYKTVMPLWLARENGFTAQGHAGNYLYISPADID